MWPMSLTWLYPTLSMVGSLLLPSLSLKSNLLQLPPANRGCHQLSLGLVSPNGYLPTVIASSRCPQPPPPIPPGRQSSGVFLAKYLWFVPLQLSSSIGFQGSSKVLSCRLQALGYL